MGLLSYRHAPLLLFFGLFVLSGVVVRNLLMVGTWSEIADTPWLTLLAMQATGLLFDAMAASWAILPLLAYLLPMAGKPSCSPRHRRIVLGLWFVTLYLLLFGIASEWIFWDEFHDRFNFIAVDYLIYTREVVGNIRESYPVGVILTALLAVAGVIFALTRGLLLRLLARPAAPLAARLTLLGLLLVLMAVSQLQEGVARLSPNQVVNQLARNGLYELFSAFRHNRLDYKTHYRTLPEAELQPRLRGLLASPAAPFANALDITRLVPATGPEKRRNVVLIVVESLSAEFLGAFGGKKNLTPHLDAIARQGVLFTNLYATGTRTVRGLEAVTLSMPPLPGGAVVRRPGHEGLSTIATPFADRGYDRRFIYGGYGYFDNMNDFYAHNGFEVVDRTNLGDDEVHFANVWGVADEDLLDRALKEMDRSHEAGRPSFSLILTTSNHRPFTYPDGRIDIASPGGREGGVKYTDYAIGRFIDQAKAKPWFDNTLIVIVADHCAGSAGRTELPVERYRIPLIFYAPSLLPPATVDALASQIDLAPTLLGHLGFSYDNRFFGRDLSHGAPTPGRAWIGNYQKVGLLQDDRLVILGPRKGVSSYQVDLTTGRATPITPPAEQLADAIAMYQGAEELFNGGKLRITPPPS